MITWTIGAGGLLGSAIERQAAVRGFARFRAGTVPWGDDEAAASAIAASAESFAEEAGDGDWAIVWAAGRVSTASSPGEARRERDLFARAMQALAGSVPAGRGAVLVSSSAGGVYAGSQGPPFDEHTPPRPLGSYGELKLDQERIAAVALAGRAPVLVCRFGNLYGPGQDLGKLQGLVSRLALPAITKQPVTMFVPLDTIRDYLDADDAAAIALHWITRVVQEQPREAQVRVVASGMPVSLGALVHLTQDITRTRFPVSVGTHASAKAQARDLRLMPSDDGNVRGLVATTLPAGIKRVYLDVLERHQASVTH